MKLAVIFRRFGAYHLARLSAAARLGPVVGIELNRTDRTYAWDVCEGADGFERLTVFSGKPVADAGPAELKRRLWDTLEAAAPDAVAVPGWAAPWSQSALAWCLARQRPAVLMSESSARDGQRRGSAEAVKRRLVRLFPAALVGGAPHRAYLEALGMDAGRIATGYDVVDNRHFRDGAERARREGAAARERLGAPARYLLASGRFIPKKNFAALLQAYADCLRGAGGALPDLVILGDGPLRPMLERRRDELSVTGRVHLPGFRQYDELPASAASSSGAWWSTRPWRPVFRYWCPPVAGARTISCARARTGGVSIRRIRGRWRPAWRGWRGGRPTAPSWARPHSG